MKVYSWGKLLTVICSFFCGTHEIAYGQLSLDGYAEEKLNKRLFLGTISESQWFFLKRICEQI